MKCRKGRCQWIFQNWLFRFFIWKPVDFIFYSCEVLVRLFCCNLDYLKTTKFHNRTTRFLWFGLLFRIFGFHRLTQGNLHLLIMGEFWLKSFNASPYISTLRVHKRTFSILLNTFLNLIGLGYLKLLLFSTEQPSASMLENGKDFILWLNSIKSRHLHILIGSWELDPLWTLVTISGFDLQMFLWVFISIILPSAKLRKSSPKVSI